MSLWGCADCTTSYAVGLAACPHCGSSARREAGSVDLLLEELKDRVDRALDAAERPAEGTAGADPEPAAPPKRRPSRARKSPR